MPRQEITLVMIQLSYKEKCETLILLQLGESTKVDDAVTLFTNIHSNVTVVIIQRWHHGDLI